MLSVEYSSQFKKDYKRCKKKHLPMEELHRVRVTLKTRGILGIFRRPSRPHEFSTCFCVMCRFVPLPESPTFRVGLTGRALTSIE